MFGVVFMLCHLFSRGRRSVARILTALSCLAATTLWADDTVSILPGASNSPVRLQQSLADDQVLFLQASDTLTNWQEIARVHGSLAAYPDFSSLATTQRFYRTVWRAKKTGDDGKNQVHWENDDFLSDYSYGQDPEPRWVKFAISLAETNKVWFQNSSKFVYHYDFATQWLPEFKGWQRAAFDAASLHLTGQRVVLGAVLFPPSDVIREVAVQFVGLEAYSQTQVAGWLDLVRQTLDLPADVKVLYFPVYEQTHAAEGYRAFLKQRGYDISSIARWVSKDKVYSEGWAMGRLVYLPANEIYDAYTDGRLLPTDILITDSIPADIPPVAGIIALVPATPNSHVAILAKSFGIPFLFLASAADQQQALAQTNRQVVLRASDNNGWSTSIRIVPTENLSTNLANEILALKTPEPINLKAKTNAGAISLPVGGLTPSDIRFVGGKAAHYGLLMRTIPSNCAPAIAFTFDLWDGFLDQTIGGSNTLRQVIHDRLAAHHYPPAMSQLRADLAYIRDLFTDVADFSSAQKTAVRTALAGFEPTRKIRFRSSTNMEDSDNFTGAGLYDSYSGCLADNLDSDDAGPCACDPFEPKERGVFRAIKKVYASFYNDNAYLERLRHGIDESQVGMGVLAHVSTPDDEELANGVATIAIVKSAAPYSRSYTLTIVGQLGAESVANPEGNVRPEQVTAASYGGSEPYLSVDQHSGLVPLGGTIMDWPADYQKLTRLIDQASQAYEALHPGRQQFWLDLEFKKIKPGQVFLKQIRPVPQPDSSGQVTPFLLQATNRFVVLQGEHGDVLAFHRLKSSWAFQVENLRLNPTNPCVINGIDASYYLGTNAQTYAGSASDLPGFTYKYEAGTDGQSSRILQWHWGEGGEERDYSLTLNLASQVASDECPVLYLSDGTLRLKATYTTPQPKFLWDSIGTTLEDEVSLAPAAQPGPNSLWQQRQFKGGSLSVTTEFYWPPAPTGPTAGYTAPVQAWVQTTITGLTAEPIQLTAEAAQTYHPGHHNFSEEFLFDPFLDPAVPDAVKAELAAKNIRALYTGNATGETQFYALGFDNQLRQLETGGGGKGVAPRP